MDIQTLEYWIAQTSNPILQCTVAVVWCLVCHAIYTQMRLGNG